MFSPPHDDACVGNESCYEDECRTNDRQRKAEDEMIRWNERENNVMRIACVGERGVAFGGPYLVKSLRG